MEVHLTPERQAQLDEFVQRRGVDPAEAIDEALAVYLEWEREEYRDTVAGIAEGYADLKAGRVQSADTAIEHLRLKHGIQSQPY